MHSHTHTQKNITIALILNIVFTIIEIIGGLLTNSLAILADALHDFGDSVVLLLSLLAEKKAQTPRNKKHTYGYKRVSLAAAFVAGVVLLSGSAVVLFHAIPRLFAPEHTNAAGMIGLAIVGIIVNGIAFLRLQHGNTQNEKILTWHVLEDVLGWVAILIGGSIMFIWDIDIIDPILTIIFTLVVLRGAYKNMKETYHMFMQGVPSSVPIEVIESEIMAHPYVVGVHDMHIWSLDGEEHVYTSHVVIKDQDMDRADQIKTDIKAIVAKYHMYHSTIEIESEQVCAGAMCEMPH